MFKQSENEAIKQHNFCGLVRLHIAISRKWCSERNPFLYVDMNAFDGSGSAAIFYEQAMNHGLPFHAYLLECDLSSVAMLNLRHANNPQVTVLPGDHNKTLDSAIQHYVGMFGKRPPMGIIYHDPTGVMSTGALHRISNDHRTERVDIVIHASGTAVKRMNGETRLIDSLTKVNKRYWLVREPSGKWQWTFLIGTNWGQFPAWQKQRFAPLYSAEGQSYARRLNDTERERQTKVQPELIPLQNLCRIPKASVVSIGQGAGSSAFQRLVRALQKAARH